MGRSVASLILLPSTFFPSSLLTLRFWCGCRSCKHAADQSASTIEEVNGGPAGGPVDHQSPAMRICWMTMKIPAGPGMEESNCQRQERSLHSGPCIYERADPLSPCSHHLLARSWSRSIYHRPELAIYMGPGVKLGGKPRTGLSGHYCFPGTTLHWQVRMCSYCCATDLPAPLDLATVI